MDESEVVFIGGRSGVGKSTVAFALHDLLTLKQVRHAVIEGDCLDLAYPAPWKDHLAERNLAAIWANYRELGYRRLIYTNTVSILEAPTLTEAMGDVNAVTSILLEASDSTVAQRLAQREQGDSLEQHLERSITMARRLDERADNQVHRINTDGKTPTHVAERILELSHWVESGEPQVD